MKEASATFQPALVSPLEPVKSVQEIKIPERLVSLLSPTWVYLKNASCNPPSTFTICPVVLLERLEARK